MARMLAVLTLVGSLAGCTSTDPITAERQAREAPIGFREGAETPRVEAGLAAGASGPLGGRAVGFYMDRQEAELRALLEGTGVTVHRNGDDLVLLLPGSLAFEGDRADLRPTFHDVLEVVALVLREYERTLVEVTGYTDSIGAASYNRDVSQERAENVARYLRFQGVDGRRIYTQGLGEARPIATNDTPQGRSRNQRVELTLIPLVG